MVNKNVIIVGIFNFTHCGFLGLPAQKTHNVFTYIMVVEDLFKVKMKKSSALPEKVV